MGFSRQEYWGGLPFPFPKSSSLVPIIQPFPHLSPSLEYALSPQGTLGPVCVVLSVLLSSPEPSRKSRSLCLL